MKPSLVFGATVDDAEPFEARWMRSAAALHALGGIGEGTVVALMLHNEPIMLELMLALRWIGARAFPVSTQLEAAELTQVLLDSEAALMIVHADLVDRGAGPAWPNGLRVLAATPSPWTCSQLGLDDAPTAQGLGLPEWADWRDGPPHPMPPQRAARPAHVDALIAAGRTRFGCEAGMRTLVSTPLYDSGANGYLLAAALHDALIVIEPRFDAEATLRLVAQHRLTHLCLAPTMFVRLLRLPPELSACHDLSSIRFVACAGAPCPGEIRRRMIEWWGPVIHERDAAGEFGPITHSDGAQALRTSGPSPAEERPG